MLNLIRGKTFKFLFNDTLVDNSPVYIVSYSKLHQMSREFNMLYIWDIKVNHRKISRFLSSFLYHFSNKYDHILKDITIPMNLNKLGIVLLQIFYQLVFPKYNNQ